MQKCTTDDNIQWLLSNDPWVEYRTRLDILEQPPDSSEVIDAYKRMVSHPGIVSLMTELSEWPGNVLNSHKSSGQIYHKLSFLADIGIKHTEPLLVLTIGKIFMQRSEGDIFQLPVMYPVHSAENGKVTYAWALCDAPVISYGVAKSGLSENPVLINVKNYLEQLCRDNGYPCKVSDELGKYRGPGRKEDPCPFATMIMLKLINLYPEDRDSIYAPSSVESLLSLWDKSKCQHPYMFFMGTDFRKLKAPLIWYDILHLADTLSNFRQIFNDVRFRNLFELIETKATKNDRFITESVWKAWESWKFGQKKQPSAWLSLLVYRMRKRLMNKN